MSWLDKVRTDRPARPTVPAPIDPFDPARTGTGQGYARAALDGEVDRLLSAQNGTRNHTLNRAAFSLSQLVATGTLDQQLVIGALTAAARQVGLDEHEILPTILSGFTAGQQHPREVPAPTVSILPAPTPDDTTDDQDDELLFVDVAALLDNGLPTAPPPVVLRRQDGHHLLYAGKVNVLFGDPESGKTWIALAACVEALNSDQRVAIIDLDHNGATEIVGRLIALGAHPDRLRKPDLFRLAEPDALETLGAVIHELRDWQPAVAVVDSLGELLPMMRLSSNSPDDYTIAHRAVLARLASCGACVIAIDHLPKNDDARAHGQTGTMAKRRAVNGVSLRVTVTRAFAPGRGGAASIVVEKDRPGGVRAHCPTDGRRQPAGKFEMNPIGEGLSWSITLPTMFDTPNASDADVAELDALGATERTQRQVMKRFGWGAHRSLKAIQRWRDLHEHDEGNDDDE